MVQAKKTAAYRVIAGPGGKRVFRFYCDISGELCCVTKSIRADAEDEALEIAWETEGRWAFDRCPQCGRYVSSATCAIVNLVLLAVSSIAGVVSAFFTLKK